MPGNPRGVVTVLSAVAGSTSRVRMSYISACSDAADAWGVAVRQHKADTRPSVVSPDDSPRLRPFFTFYGGKWRVAEHYSAPRYSTIIEPFAGAAGFSVRHAAHRVILIDIDPYIVGTWRYLTKVSPRELLALPDLCSGQTTRDLRVPEEARYLIGWWLNGGSAQPKRSAGAWMRRQIANGGKGWITGGGQLMWGQRVRERLAAQVPHIRHWSVLEGDYHSAPDVRATWFIDPPYVDAGKYYRFGSDKLDYRNLALWCRSRNGQTTVCENVGATWLPFRSWRRIKASEAKHGGKISHEAIWTNDAAT